MSKTDTRSTEMDTLDIPGPQFDPPEALIDLDETTLERPSAFDDPVPGLVGPGVVAGPDGGSDVEARVMQQLSRDTALEFDSLTVRRVQGGLLVEGVVRGVEERPESEDLSELVRQIADVGRVDNRLLIRG